MTEPDIGATVNEWVNVVRRARLPANVKLTALLLASYADKNGTKIFPGVARLTIQSDLSYSTVQRALRRLRNAGLIEALPRAGMPRHLATGYRLIFAADLLDKVDVPTPATEQALVDSLTKHQRGRHRKAKSARHVDDAQNSDCTSPDDPTARHAQHSDQQEPQPPSIDLSITTNPPYVSADVVARGTGSTRSSSDDNSDISVGEVNGQRRPSRWVDPRAEAIRQAAESRAARLAREGTRP